MDTDKFQKDLDKCVDALQEDLSSIRTGRPTPELVEDILVDAYGTQGTIKSYANITVSDAKSIVISPWDKSIIGNVSKALSDSDKSFSAVVEGDHVRVILPDLTEERRKEYVKIMKDRVEDARVAVRNVRQQYMQEVDKLENEGMSEDDAKRLRETLEKFVKEYNEMIESIRDEKEKSLMTI
ncbi:MAG: ribosome recycling factor [Candidatus Dojkabacteria bacterium]|jgi:ribosome recycling factor|nr:ribosome recycling factor [Candidatus Dojkabacteria bacterium]MDD2270111.1 ribosome recycling factor [Candidatus Dojkabacteria bacterium]